MMFFASGSANVDARFDAMLKEIAVRLADNPDVIVEIRGYYHISGDGASGGGELAKRRAEAVRQKLIAFDKKIEARVFVQPSIDATKLYRGDHGSLDPKIRQENQRAEISVRQFDELMLSFDNTEPKRIIEKLKGTGKLYRIQRLLLDNPLMFMFIEGKDFSALRKLQAALQKEFGEPAAQRIFIALTEQNGARMSIHADWVIEKPIAFARVNGNPDNAEIAIASKSGGAIKVFQAHGLPVAAPSSAWRLDKIPCPLDKYFASVLVATQSGHLERQWSKAIEFQPAGDWKKFTVDMHIACYERDQLQPESAPSANANRYIIAERIASLAKAHRGKKIEVSVLGYVDDTGDPEKNCQMSQYWADLELSELRKLLDGFGVANKVEISAQGKSNADNGAISGMKIDENTPEGRIGKRRGMAQMKF